MSENELVCYCMICGAEWESFYDVKSHLYTKHEVVTMPGTMVGHRQKEPQS